MAIMGAHLLIYSSEAEKVRAIFRDVFDMPFIGEGDGWLIFTLPPAELGVHPAGPGDSHVELSLMVDDIHETRRELEAKGMTFTGEPHDEGWGIFCTMNLPGGGTLGVYQPKHQLAITVT
jgi:hypothetical protein